MLAHTERPKREPENVENRARSDSFRAGGGIIAVPPTTTSTRPDAIDVRIDIRERFRTSTLARDGLHNLFETDKTGHIHNTVQYTNT